jgi:methionine-rich copper-binding protein CopC
MTYRPKLGAAFMVAVLTITGSAQAHPKLISSTPAPNATVVKPARVVLNFSERLIGPLTGGDILMAGMPGMTSRQPVHIAGVKAAVAANGKALVFTMKTPLAPGRYRVNWHAVSTDTHRVQGSLAFNVK